MKIEMLCLLIAVLATVKSKIVQVPPLQPEETIYLRLEQLLAIDSSFDSFGTLSRIHERVVYELKDGK